MWGLSKFIEMSVWKWKCNTQIAYKYVWILTAQRIRNYKGYCDRMNRNLSMSVKLSIFSFCSVQLSLCYFFNSEMNYGF